jgi:Domain of unknown function (DUF222)
MGSQAEWCQLIRSGMDQIVDALRGAAGGDLDPEQLTEILGAVFCQRNRLDAAVSRAVGALHGAAERAPDGELTRGLDCATWLSHTLQISSSAAYAQVRLARQLPGLPDTAAAFERGELSAQHASVIARSVEAVIRGGGNPSLAEGMLLEEAGKRDTRSLYRWGLSLVHQLAPQEMEAEEERRERRRYLRLTESFDGGYELEGYLDPVRGARLKTAIQGVLGPRKKGDERTSGQRCADGLDEIATRVLDRGELPVRGGQRPHLTITASLETLRADPGAPAALLDWGFPLSGKALRRIARDAEITPILINKKGDPLHVGRKYRTATPKMRRALDERDRQCIFPGCTAHPEWTEGHHEVPWERDGLTDIDEMSLLCGRHHRMVTRGWRLERRPDGSLIAHPPPRPGPVYGPAVYQAPPQPP